MSPVDGELLRFFVYWRQHAQMTDFDLSALMFDEDYSDPEWLSYTNLTIAAGEHSGDITSAPEGASEFINLTLNRVSWNFIVPQVHIYSGRGSRRSRSRSSGSCCATPSSGAARSRRGPSG